VEYRNTIATVSSVTIFKTCAMPSSSNMPPNATILPATGCASVNPAVTSKITTDSTPIQ
jgi:hypothetical protein